MSPGSDELWLALPIATELWNQESAETGLRRTGTPLNQDSTEPGVHGTKTVEQDSVEYEFSATGPAPFYAQQGPRRCSHSILRRLLSESTIGLD